MKSDRPVRLSKLTALGFVAVMLLQGCGGNTGPTGARTDAGNAPAPTGPKRLVVAVLSDPPTLISKFERTLPGSEAIEFMVAAGLSIPNDQGGLTPVMVEEVPTVENNLWKLFPDGRMETTFTLRPNLQWHDGVRFTTQDLLFTAEVGQARGMRSFRHAGYAAVERIEARDERTIVVAWKTPYIEANTLFNNSLGGQLITFPLPRHVLEPTFVQDQADLAQSRYWSEDFVGTGAYKLKEWIRGAYAILQANDAYALGRPRVDAIELRFIPDSNTLVANVLSGQIHATIGRGLSLEQALETSTRWSEGAMDNFGNESWLALYPQFINPNPALIGTSADFRRALTHALDRGQVVDSLMHGLVPVAHVRVSLSEPGYAELEPYIVRYDYDSRRASQIVASLGYAADDRGMFRNAASELLSVEIRATPGDIEDKLLGVIADYWKAVGVTTDTLAIPVPRQTDIEWRSTRPGFELTRRNTRLIDLNSFHTRDIPRPETRFIGRNTPRYSTPEMDLLIDRYYVTVPTEQRTRIVGEILRIMSDQLPMLPLFYDTEPALVASRVSNVRAKPPGSTSTWNVHLWDLR